MNKLGDKLSVMIALIFGENVEFYVYKFLINNR
jgi:hypothetical protein